MRISQLHINYKAPSYTNDFESEIYVENKNKN